MRYTDGMTTSAPSSSELVARISVLGKQIQDEIKQVLMGLPSDGPIRPQRLARALGLNKSLASKLLIAIDSRDPLAVVHGLPGPFPLRSFLDAAAAQGVSASTLVRARSAVNAFEELLREHFDERGELDTLLGSSLHDVRVKAESAAKQSMFRGAVGICGVQCETTLSSYLIHPSRVSTLRCDMAVIGGMVGLRRLRPDALVEYVSTAVLDQPGQPREERRTLSDGPLVRAFGSADSLPISVAHKGQCSHYRLTGDTVGRQSALNLVVGEFWRAALPKAPEEGLPTRRWVGTSIQQPSQRLVLDVLLHESVWPNRQPELLIHNTTLNGPCDPTDPDQAARLLNLAESIKFLGLGGSRARHADILQYTDALEEVTAAHGWPLEEFRVFRCEIQYPPYGLQVCVAFDIR